MVIHVASVSDPRLDDYRNIPDPELLRRRGIFIAEGRHVVRRLLTGSRFAARSILVTPPALASLADVLGRFDRLPVYVVGQDELNAVTGFNIHRGCLAVGAREPLPAWEALAAGAARLLVLERVANADNVGGLFRSAAAFGVEAVLLGPACADPLYRKAIRTSMGATLRVPFATLGTWPSDLERLKALGVRLLACTPAADAEPLPGVAPPPRTALLVGHEGEGLSAEAFAAADARLRIPMAPGVDSLNVATAAAIAMYGLWYGRPSLTSS